MSCRRETVLCPTPCTIQDMSMHSWPSHRGPQPGRTREALCSRSNNCKMVAWKPQHLKLCESVRKELFSLPFLTLFRIAWDFQIVEKSIIHFQGATFFSPFLLHEVRNMNNANISYSKQKKSNNCDLRDHEDSLIEGNRCEVEDAWENRLHRRYD